MSNWAFIMTTVVNEQQFIWFSLSAADTLQNNEVQKTKVYDAELKTRTFVQENTLFEC